jgi:hypothetical protein
LNLTEFVVITCDRPLPAAAEESGNTDVGETSDGEEADEAREYDENDQAQEHEQAESEDALAVVDEYDPEDDEMFEE